MNATFAKGYLREPPWKALSATSLRAIILLFAYLKEKLPLIASVDNSGGIVADFYTARICIAIPIELFGSGAAVVCGTLRVDD